MYVQRLKTFNDTEIQENARALNDEIQPRALDIVFGAFSLSLHDAHASQQFFNPQRKTLNRTQNSGDPQYHRAITRALVANPLTALVTMPANDVGATADALKLPIRISTGMFGLGAFAETDIPAHKYIGEYFGEIFSEPDSMEYISQVQKHTGLNYAFSLARGVQLDSHTVGNETRYLNHSQIPNCRARIIYVNGDPRIVLETEEDVKEGQELFLDYGPFYWNQGGPAHDNDDHE
ncbi:hypothetical protein NLJ89_g7256 [Agrocybe chaxingu]|uniref:SET domain-containing protein n=1 Tax=Agrocybe chaxingu TaxID=84603 RepID=A0A9W8JX59_9AGAR|nr:hypothetical protein NLJ89_g7256 [Agrocybe chaxingu]